MTVYEDGLAVRWLRATRVVRWGEVAEVYFAQVTLLNRKVAVGTDRGERVPLPESVAKPFQAFELICKKVRPRLRKELRAALADGEKVAFGKLLAVSRAGLTVKKKSYKWAEVTKLTWGAENHTPGNMFAVRSTLWVETDGAAVRLPTDDIPNLPILLKVLKDDYGVKVEQETGMFG